MKPFALPVKRCTALFTVLLLFTGVAAASHPNTQFRKPTDFTDNNGDTTRGTDAFDFPAQFDNATFAVTGVSGNPDPSVTWHTWNTTDKLEYTSLELAATVNASGFGDDQWGIFFDNSSTDTSCDSTDNALKPFAANNTGSLNYSRTLPATQNISNIQTCLVINTQGQADTAELGTFDIRTEGIPENTAPHWENPRNTTPATYNSSFTSRFNVTWTDDFDTDGFDIAVFESNFSGSLKNYSTYRVAGTNTSAFNTTLPAGTHQYRFYANDSDDAWNATDTFTVTVDKAPTTTSLFINDTRSDQTFNVSTPANFTVETNVSGRDVSLWTNFSNGVWKEWDAGVEPFTNITVLDALGTFNWTGNFSGDANYTASTETWHTTVQDVAPPQWTENATHPSSPATYKQDRTHQFNVTWTDTHGVNTVTIEHNFSGTLQNETVTRQDGDTYIFEQTSLAAGTYQWREYANDSTGNLNATDTFTYVVEKAPTETQLFLNGSRSDRTYTVNTTANFTVETNVSDRSVSLWTNFSDGTWKEWDSGVEPLINLTELDTTGVFNWTGNFSGNENYTSSTETWTTTVKEEEPSLNITLNEPQNNSIIPHHRNFTVNMTATCLTVDCGSVDFTAQYNETGDNPDTAIPTTSGSTPFHTFNPNPQSCSLSVDENCTVTWTVNASGTLDTMHTINVHGDTGSVTNHSANHTVEIGKVLLFDLTFDFVSFGVVDPGADNNPAQQNDQNSYNISIPANSNDLEKLWVKSGPLNRESSLYNIRQTNLSFSFTNDPTTETQFNPGYTLMSEGVAAGQNLTTYYWLDMPFGIADQTFNNTLQFKANATW